MPGKKVTATPVEVKSVEVKAEEAVVEKPKKKSSKAVTPATESVPVATEAVATEAVTEGATEKKARKVITKEYIEGLFESLETELASILADVSEKKVISAKRVRGVQRQVKTLRTDSLKISKQKRQSTRTSNTQSGFMKPVNISKELAKFTGWSHDQPKSRIEVTQFLCKYVKENNLQNPADKRQIVPDQKLAKLLAFDSKEGVPLTYPLMQKKIQPHFSNIIA
jgi:chromatin remodeling complex protein RSC6